jgi:hypothetical protein|tara:strand:- start:48 stop:782 length:735 start_codon:yes stop_codon:yes gene_type:complete
MPGGYGTRDTPWGAGGTRAPSGSYSRSAGPARGGGSSVTQGSNQQANRINRQREQQSNAYINNASNFKDPRQQLAASLKAAGAVTSGALGGTALWKLPIDYFTEEELESGINPENTFESTFVEGQQAYSPTGIITIEGEDGIPAYISRDEDGNLIPNPDPLANKYKVFNPYKSPHGGSGNNYNYRRGYGSLGQQMYAMGLPGIMYGDMQGENRYSPLNMNEFMVNVHSPMYANRGGIIDLLGDY